MPYKDPEKRREYARQLAKAKYNADPEAARARNRAQYKRNGLALAKKWAASNPEKVKTTKQRHRENHRAELREKAKGYYHADAEAARAKSKSYKKANPGRIRALNQKRRALQMGAKGNYTDTEFRTLCFIHGDRCVRCREQRPLTADHILPLSKGGPNYIGNIQPLCKRCNSIKHTLHADYRGTVLLGHYGRSWNPTNTATSR